VKNGAQDKAQDKAMDKAMDMDSLKARHQELESQIAALEAQLSLSPREQAERARLKKEKLAIKDRMALLATTPRR
jgi:uncharacterized protein YdcH (DUF465 family)